MIVNTFSGQMIVLVDLSTLIFLQMLFDAFNVPYVPDCIASPLSFQDGHVWGKFPGLRKNIKLSMSEGSYLHLENFFKLSMSEGSSLDLEIFFKLSMSEGSSLRLRKNFQTEHV